MLLSEAVTIRHQARTLLRSAKDLLANKTLSQALRDQLDGLEGALKRTWGDLEAEATDAEVMAAAEAAMPLTEMIRQEGEKWCLYSKDGKKKLGEFDSKEEAMAREREIVAAKHAKAEEAADIELVGDVIPLVEAKALRADGTIRAKIIAPGWGSSGYYGADMLKRDGPRVFTKGLKSYWDHPTLKEEAERPERSLRDLAGELTSDAAWDANGPKGPGLYSDLKVFTPYQETVAELAPHIGMSIRALGKPKLGEAEGRRGTLVEQIVAAKSLDFVTQAGAGGQIVSLFEAARGRAAERQPEEVMVTEEEATVLRESNATLTAEKAQALAEVKRLQEAAVQREARDLVAEAVGKSDLPAPAKTRIAETLAGTVPLKEGALDKEGLNTAVAAALDGERKYIAALAPVSGGIRGMGGSATPTEGTALRESFLRLYRAQGKNEAESEKLANAAAGR